MFPRALSQWTYGCFRWMVVLTLCAILVALWWAWRPHPASTRPHATTSTSSLTSCGPQSRYRSSGRRYTRRLVATAYTAGDGFTPGTVAADGTLATVGTLAVSPDLRAALWERRLCLDPHPIWLPSGCGRAADIMSAAYRGTIDVYAPLRLLALLWGRRSVTVSWCG